MRPRNGLKNIRWRYFFLLCALSTILFASSTKSFSVGTSNPDFHPLLRMWWRFLRPLLIHPGPCRALSRGRQMYIIHQAKNVCVESWEWGCPKSYNYQQEVSPFPVTLPRSCNIHPLRELNEAIQNLGWACFCYRQHERIYAPVSHFSFFRVGSVASEVLFILVPLLIEDLLYDCMLYLKTLKCSEADASRIEILQKFANSSQKSIRGWNSFVNSQES